MKYLAAYAVAGAVFLILDLIWIGYIAKGFYAEGLGALMAERINIGAAIAFYLLFMAGLVFFAVAPALEAGGPWRAFLLGAALGCVAYGTYDLTNLATMKGFPLSVALVDLAWGSALSGVSAAVAAYAAAQL